jgi:large subunit ribosomal protein L19
MTNLLQKYEEGQVARLSNGKELSDFRAGDVVRVMVKIIDGASERIQVFEGLCIARKNRGMASSFTVRKISHGEGVERIFPLYSPRVEGVEIVRRGVIRRAKLYYMRDLTGKAARIQEKRETISSDTAGDADAAAQLLAKKEAKAAKKAAKAERKAAPKEAKKARKPKKKAENN